MTERFSVLERPMDGLIVVEATRRQDDRGFFEEVFRRSDFESLGLPETIVQVNHSRSLGSVRRGLHFQWSPAMGKAMRVTRGSAFLVAVDLRLGSPTLGEWFSRVLSEDDSVIIAAPAGFARGFQTLSECTEVEYFTTGEYNGATEGQIRWNDPQIGIEWPPGVPTMSEKDQSARTLAEWLEEPESRNFIFETGERR